MSVSGWWFTCFLARKDELAKGHISFLIRQLMWFNMAWWWLCMSKPAATLHTYLLTPWRTVLLEKLTGSANSQEIPRIFGTRKFITVLTNARHLSLSWANSIQSPQPPPNFWRSILILSSHLRLGLPIGLFPSGFSTRTLCNQLPAYIVT